MTDRPTRTACHEGGHALVARMLGLPVFAIEVGGGASHTRSGYRVAGDAETATDQLAVRLAGIAAEYVCGYVRPVRGTSDLRAADRLAAELDPDDVLGEVGRALERDLRLLGPHRAALLALAASLDDSNGVHGQARSEAAIDAALAIAR